MKARLKLKRNGYESEARMKSKMTYDLRFRYAELGLGTRGNMRSKWDLGEVHAKLKES
jgi:hypothetical protein